MLCANAPSRTISPFHTHRVLLSFLTVYLSWLANKDSISGSKFEEFYIGIWEREINTQNNIAHAYLACIPTFNERQSLWFSCRYQSIGWLYPYSSYLSANNFVSMLSNWIFDFSCVSLPVYWIVGGSISLQATVVAVVCVDQIPNENFLLTNKKNNRNDYYCCSITLLVLHLYSLNCLLINGRRRERGRKRERKKRNNNVVSCTTEWHVTLLFLSCRWTNRRLIYLFGSLEFIRKRKKNVYWFYWHFAIGSVCTVHQRRAMSWLLCVVYT